MTTSERFGTEKISRILWKLAPPVMLAQLIQALYNSVDSLFVGRYSGSGLTALSIKPVMHVDDEGHLIKMGTARGRGAGSAGRRHAARRSHG